MGGLILLATLAAMPASEASHCRSGIEVYGRTPNAPALVPPASPVGRICFPVMTTIDAGHDIAPGSEQIYVRVEGDSGMSYPTLLLRLQGLGFQGQSFVLARTPGTIPGQLTYELGSWLTIPDAPHAAGTLRATVRFPGGYEQSVDYSLSELPI